MEEEEEEEEDMYRKLTRRKKISDGRDVNFLREYKWMGIEGSGREGRGVM